MMRTLKKKIKNWKIAAMALVIAGCFVFVACQDQVADELSKSTISQSGYPEEVRKQMEKYLIDHPDAKLTYLDGDPDEVNRLMESAEVKNRIVYTYDLKEGGIHKKGLLLSNIVQYAESLRTDDNVFMVVEHQPEFPGGFDALREFLRQNLKYPEAAKNAGISGTVYVSMVINEDGKVSDTKILRGISQDADAEALRVVNMLPAWNPGTQDGKAVRVRYTVPIRFGGTTPKEPLVEGN